MIKEISGKINNIFFENINISNEGDNYLYINECKEEFFNVYNVNIFGKNVLCEGKNVDFFECDLLFDGKKYKIPFNVILSDRNKIIINENFIKNGKAFKLKNDTIFEKKKDALHIIQEDLKKEKEIEIFKEKINEEKIKILNEYNSIKKEFSDLENKKEKINDEIIELEEKHKCLSEEKVIIETKNPYKSIN